MKKKSFFIHTLGCAKNLVDSFTLSNILKEEGLSEEGSSDFAEYIIINTCGFIKEAKEESLSTIKGLVRRRKKDQIIIVSGCMSQRYKEMMLNWEPKIDGLMGTRNLTDIKQLISQINEAERKPVSLFKEPISNYTDIEHIPSVVIQGGSSYLKVSDGCRHHCAYCAIPLIKGTLRSHSIDKLLKDIKFLLSKDVKEINLIAQDLTDYGSDLGLKDGLPKLIKQIISAAPSIPWIRLLYTFPGHISNDLINIMATESQVLPYLDIPLQHADPDMLKAMHRPSNIKEVITLIEEMRKRIPDLSIRSTFIVGYPGETENKFQNLLKFIEQIRFDHVGVFTYSLEENTPAEILGDPISFKVKNERRNELMEIQSKISYEINQTFINKKLDVLIEGKDEKTGILVGRSYRDAPEVDNLTIVRGYGNIGDLIPVKITQASAYDLIGDISK
jgi:ribosomal protein S12 methylthiotransferase